MTPTPTETPKATTGKQTIGNIASMTVDPVRRSQRVKGMAALRLRVLIFLGGSGRSIFELILWWILALVLLRRCTEGDRGVWGEDWESVFDFWGNWCWKGEVA